jgi:hypothetical protein
MYKERSQRADYRANLKWRDWPRRNDLLFIPLYLFLMTIYYYKFQLYDKLIINRTPTLRSRKLNLWQDGYFERPFQKWLNMDSGRDKL